MSKPNLFIIGAPKCGTTTISNWLSLHPSVYMSKIKEPHYFYSPYGRPMPLSDYENLFKNIKGTEKYIGEASVWYLFSKDAVSKIQEYSNSPKYIVCLRNPLEMAPSMHAQKVFTGHEVERDFTKAWGLSSKREEGHYVSIYSIPNGDPSHMAYRKSCLLGEQVQRLLGKVERSSVHFILMDDLKKDSSSVWKSLENFLQIDHFDLPNYDKSNTATARKSYLFHYILIFLKQIKARAGLKKSFGILGKLGSLNVSHEQYRRPEDIVIREMKENFKDDIVLLSDLIGRDLSHWYSV